MYIHMLQSYFNQLPDQFRRNILAELQIKECLNFPVWVKQMSESVLLNFPTNCYAE